MANVTVLNCWRAETYPFTVPCISFNEYVNGGAQLPYPLSPTIKDVQRIFCDDVTEEIDSTYRLFDYIDALKIINFLDKHRGKEVMVHCAAGVSRSPGVAKWMIDYCGYTVAPINDHDDFFKCHNTHVYYTLKRAMLDHPDIIQRIKDANHG